MAELDIWVDTTTCLLTPKKIVHTLFREYKDSPVQPFAAKQLIHIATYLLRFRGTVFSRSRFMTASRYTATNSIFAVVSVKFELSTIK